MSIINYHNVKVGIIIYHNVKVGVPCPDGLAAAWVASKVYPEARIVGCVYGDLLPGIRSKEEVIIVDFSFPKPMLESLANRGCLVTVIDHHKTAWENLNNLDSRINKRFDMQECGATLTWKHFFPDKPMPAFLEYVRDRDLWLHKLPMTHEIHAATGKIGRSLALYEMLEPMSAEHLQAVFGKLGTQLLEEKHNQVKSICLRALPVHIGNHRAHGVRLNPAEEYLTSDVCSYLYTTMFPEDEFVCCITSGNIISLRSNREGSNFDVGNLAAQYLGGGHKNSAGFKGSTLLTNDAEGSPIIIVEGAAT